MRFISQIFPLFLLVYTSACSSSGGKEIDNFAEKVIDIVVSKKVDLFDNLPCFPEDCVGEDELEFIFGTKKKPGFVSMFLSRPNIKFKAYGPITYQTDPVEEAYVIIFYDPLLVKFTSKGVLNEEDRKDFWWKGYVETVVSFQNGNWGFYRTPFYYGAHIPWVDDY